MANPSASPSPPSSLWSSTPARLSGVVWKRNAGVLRQWRSRSAEVTADGFLRYRKKEDGIKTKDVDLVRATFSTDIWQANGYHYFELRSGAADFALGFPERSQARRWLDAMLEAADENAAGRRTWLANLRRMLTLKLRDRRQLVPAMAERDWLGEWSFCLRSLQDKREPISARKRRLKRLHTIWLQFELFAELLAEIFFSSVQKRDADGLARIESFERAASTFALTGSSESRAGAFSAASLGVPASAASLMSSSSTSSLSSASTPGSTGSWSSSTKPEDVDEVKLPGLRLEFASKSWQGHKRLAKDASRLSKFRSLLELFIAESKTNADGAIPANLRTVLAALPSFPLIAAFSLRGVRVTATAEPPRIERSTLVTMDTRDFTGLSRALREAKMLRYFPFQELPEFVVRRVPGNNQPTLVRVRTRYDDVLLSSLRSSMVYGVLVRGGDHGTGQVEILSALDLKELSERREPRWIPYLDLEYYQLESSSVANKAAQAFVFSENELSGDVVVAVDADKSKLALNLPEAFVRKHHMDLHPLVHRLEEVKKSKAIFALAANSGASSGSGSPDTAPSRVIDAGHLAREYEDGVKKLFLQHIHEFAAQLVTLGDVPESPTAGFTATSGFGRSRAPTWVRTAGPPPSGRVARSNTFSTMPRSNESFATTSLERVESDQGLRPPIRRRQSSLASMAQALGTGSGPVDSNSGTYVIDTLHLRQVMREGGVNMRFLPLVFRYLNNRRQQGVQMLVASEIVARLAKNLFRHRLLNDTRDKTSRWRSRKTRLIRFIDSIMHGLFHKNLPDGCCSIQECTGDQFWDVDAPIQYALGVFSSSFALDPQAQTEVTGTAGVSLDKYRNLLKVNPAMLFTSLLHVFDARLTKSILPELQENRFVSVPFLRTESDLTFNSEEDDPKLALQLDQELLWSNLQFFRLQFDELQPGPPPLHTRNEAKPACGGRTQLTTWAQYYRSLSHIFRQSLGYPQLTRLEKAVQSWEDVTTVRAHLSLALRAAAVPTSLPLGETSGAVITEHCQLAANRMAGSKALFPVEFKLALRCLELISTGQELAQAVENCDELLEWLRFFYRPANPSQFAKGSSSHPVFAVQYSTVDGLDDKLAESDHFSLRARFQRKQTRETWMGVMANVDAYCRRIEEMRRNPVDVAATRAVLGEMNHRRQRLLPPASLGMAMDDPESPRASTESEIAAGDTYKPPTDFEVNETSLPSVMYSSRGDALWFIECFFLPPLATNSLLVAGHALMFDDQIAQRIRESAVFALNDGPVPGLALTWGKPTGLSLDEEAHMNNGARAATSSLRPSKDTASQISILSFPGPLRRVVQVACGYRHTALITDDRHLHTFGYGECGRLGHGTEDSCLEPTDVGYFTSLIEAEGVDVGGVVDVACGREHTMAVTAKGELFGFGWGEAGRLGTGEGGSKLFPSRVTGLEDVIAVACGREHTLVLKRSGDVFSFGAGFGGRLGNGSEKDEELPYAVGDMEGYVIQSIDAGECHSCAVSSKGDVFTWGFGSSGALGHGSRDNCLVPTLVDGPWASHKQAEVSTEEENQMEDHCVVTAVACGSYHTLACTSDGVLYGWGDAAAGQLGIEYVTAEDMVVLSPQPIRVPTSAGLRSVACGTFTSAVCTQDGRLFLWGSPAAGNGAPLDTEDARVQRIGVLGEFECSQIACGAYHAVALTRKLEYC